METLALAIIESLAQPMRVGGQDMFVSCSIGVVHMTGTHASPDDVLRDSDIAMYHAKRNSTGSYAIFTPAMLDRAVEALDLRTDLRHAIARNELVLQYQPIFDVRTRDIVAVEALVRWQHPRRGTVLPGHFIETAEETGLIHDIGRWVLGEACGQVRRWQAEYPTSVLRVNVNVSGEELKSPGFLQGVTAALTATAMEPSRLQLEITESVFLQQPQRVGDILDSIRALGVKIALDDFGTGYSSLSYLDRYQVDTIKIDRSFVDGLPSRPRAVAIVETIVSLGLAVGLDVVAEGVENSDQLQSLQRAGCSLVQGYLLGRPASPQDVAAALAKQSASRSGDAASSHDRR